MRTTEEMIAHARAMGVEVETDIDGAPVRWDGQEAIGGELAALDEDTWDGTAVYVPLALYNGGGWDEADLIEVDLEWPEQEGEHISGWFGSDYDQPNYVTSRIRPGDDAYDWEEERPGVLADARQRALAEWAGRKARLRERGAA